MMTTRDVGRRRADVQILRICLCRLSTNSHASRRFYLSTHIFLATEHDPIYWNTFQTAVSPIISDYLEAPRAPLRSIKKLYVSSRVDVDR